MSTENTDSDRKKQLVRVARIAAGVLFLILGVIGSLLPVLQGWLFFLFALIAFFPEHPRVAGILAKAEPKMPRLVRGLRKLGIGITVDESERSTEAEGNPDGDL